jgi:hypothetical protein
MNPNNQSLDASFESLNAEYLQRQVEQGKSIAEIASDYAKAKTTTTIINNENGEYDDLHQEFVEEQKETLKEGFKQDRIKSQAKTLTEKQRKAEAFYVSFRPILEFDFSNLIKKSDGDRAERHQKEYKDRSYGILLMVLMLCLFIVPYCVVSIVLAVFNGINSLFRAISTFEKITKRIIVAIAIIVVTLVVVYYALIGIDAFFGTSILKKIGL